LFIIYLLPMSYRYGNKHYHSLNDMVIIWSNVKLVVYKKNNARVFHTVTYYQILHKRFLWGLGQKRRDFQVFHYKKKYIFTQDSFGKPGPQKLGK
jgi:hypothetical protein